MRRITGVLVTFTWQPQGELFVIHDGKNYIGAGNAISEGGQRPCDVQITSDPMLSKEHALILCRRGRYELVDQKSSNGTFLNDTPVPLQGTQLQDKDTIKAGSTAFIFRSIEAEGVVSREAAASTSRVDEEPAPPGDSTIF